MLSLALAWTYRGKRCKGGDRDRTERPPVFKDSLYSTSVTTSNGYSESDDSRLSVHLTSLGATGSGTNPEQLFGAGYSACFIEALKVAGKRNNVELDPAGIVVKADVSLGALSDPTLAGGYGISVSLSVTIPLVEPRVAQKLLDDAHYLICPFSHVTRGVVNVNVQLADSK